MEMKLLTALDVAGRMLVAELLDASEPTAYWKAGPPAFVVKNGIDRAWVSFADRVAFCRRWSFGDDAMSIQGASEVEAEQSAARATLIANNPSGYPIDEYEEERCRWEELEAFIDELEQLEAALT